MLRHYFDAEDDGRSRETEQNDPNRLDLEYSTNKTLKDLNKYTEDQYILAFRQYTRAIISFSFFVKIDEESRHRFLYNEERRLEYMRGFDRIGLDALVYFEKCLESWPFQGGDNDQAMTPQQMLTRGLSQITAGIKINLGGRTTSKETKDRCSLNTNLRTPDIPKELKLKEKSIFGGGAGEESTAGLDLERGLADARVMDR